MSVGCVIKRPDLTDELTLTADQMERFGHSEDARKALRGPCVFALYAASADRIRIGSTRHVIKRWSTLDDGSPEPLRLIMVWRAPDMETAEKQEAFLLNHLALFSVTDRRNWFDAQRAARALMTLTSWEPLPDPAPEPKPVLIRDLVEEAFTDLAPRSVTDVIMLTRLFQRISAWQRSAAEEDMRRVKATMTALRDSGVGDDTIRLIAGRVGGDALLKSVDALF